MDINRDIQVLGGLENGPEFRIIQIFAARVAVDNCALQTKLAHAALQFLGCAGGILRRDSGKAGESAGMFANGIGQLDR